jgi:hypothetical protein
MGRVDFQAEWLACTFSCAYFVHNYCYIYDAVEKSWVPFHLWKEQMEVLNDLQEYRLNVILKARQLGQTWLVLCFILWLMLFFPAVTALLFSRRDDEAQNMLSFRLLGIYKRLPRWMQAKRVITSNSHEWALSNDSVAYAFPTTAGDSYTASVVLVDEADLIENLPTLMTSVKPTIDNGGRMVLLSRSDKNKPQSLFKNIYRAAKSGENAWHSIFLPWYVHPKRSQAWYDEQVQDSLANTGSLDDVWEQYPATDAEALAPRVMSKRLPAPWLNKCLVAMKPNKHSPLMSISPKLDVFVEPSQYGSYVIGADPAEGNPTSDPSSLTVLDMNNGEEVAHLADRIEPSLFADIIAQLSREYNNAAVLPERNNHGHVVIKALKDEGDIPLLAGLDGIGGWHTNAKSKSTMYSTAADAFKEGDVIIHSEDTYYQLASIEGATLKAPEGQFDDRATSFCLAIQAQTAKPAGSFHYGYVIMPVKKVDRRIAALGAQQ